MDIRLNLYIIIDRFRIQRQILRADSNKLSLNRSAFSSSLQGQEQGQGRQQRKPPKCMCEERHWYWECLYLSSLNGAQPPTGWKEDPAIRKRFDEELKKLEKKKIIENTLKR